MRKVGISADLERRLRAALEGHGGDGYLRLIEELVAKLDEDVKKRETGSMSSGPGLGYKELVSLFRLHLGADLVMPISQPEGWYIKMVALAKNKGVTKDNVEQICTGLRRNYRAPYRFEWVVGNADLHFHNGTVVGPHDGKADSVSYDGGRGGTQPGTVRNPIVYTGRGEDGDNQGE